MPAYNYTNVFQSKAVAAEYDNYYNAEMGKAIDRIEKELILSHIRHLPKDNMLELGCGTGHWSAFFSEEGFKLTAVDSSDAMLDVAKGKGIKGVDFKMADAGQLPFADNRFTVIVSVTMLEFVEDVKRVMDETDRVLAPGGTFIVGCLNDLSEIGKNKDNDPVFKHGSFFTPEAVKNLLSRFGHPSLSKGVYLSPEFKLLDGTPLQNTVQPAFIAASVKKTNHYGNNR